jgi:hypothetical protein
MTKMKMRIALCAAIITGACAELPQLGPDVCGNGVIEAHLDEQCDMSEDETLGSDVRCGDPSDVLRACHYVCSRSESGPTCPTGWGCSDDGVCRYASGEVVELDESPIDLEPYKRLQIADIDGDQRMDLVAGGESGISVYYGKRTDPFVSRFHSPVPSLSREVALGDVDRDGNQDLVAMTGVGPILLTGQRGRSLESVIVPRVDLRRIEVPIEWMRVIPLKLDESSQCATIEAKPNLLAVGTGDRLLISYAEREPIAQETIAVANLPGRFAVADLSGVHRGYSDEELIVALPGRTQVHVYEQACVMRPNNSYSREMRDYSVPLPHPVVRLPHILFAELAQDTALPADLDGDGDLDLLFAVSDGLENRVVRVENMGSEFGPARVFPQMRALADVSAQIGGDGDPFSGIHVAQAWPLAAGDLDGDGDADFVGTTGIYSWMSDGEDSIPGNELIIPQSPQNFAEAVIADFDGDGLNDIIAVQSGDGALLAFLSQQGFGNAMLAPPIEIPASGVPTLLRAADFDGDTTSDIAWVERGAHFGATLTVMYTGGGSFAQTAFASAGSVVDIAPGIVGDDDQRADLLLVEKVEGAEQPWSIGFLFGTQERTMLSPLPVGDLSLGEGYAVLGNFLADSSDDLDLAVLSPLRIELAPGNGTPQYGADQDLVVRKSWIEVLGAESPYVPTECVRATAADVENDGVSELVLVVDGACRERYEGPGLPTILAVGTQNGGNFSANLIRLPSSIRNITALHALQLDDDVAPELVIASSGGVAIYWNARDLRGQDPSIVLLENGTMTPYALASLNADDRPDLELAILGGNPSGHANVWIAKLGAAGAVELSEPILELEISPRESPSLLALDVDRDGLSDLVFGDGARVHVYRSRPEGEVVR